MVLRAGTPAGIVTKTGNLETHLDLPAGNCWSPPTTPAAPASCSGWPSGTHSPGLAHPRCAAWSVLLERVIGARIDGSPLAVPLLGVHAVVIGSSGAGKSTTLRILADAVTACGDALIWDLDGQPRERRAARATSRCLP
ncbi:MAG: hypothetical protein M3143_12515 [Actinomycetota bacterium]|nr:hypothetical protein [Actinomycetota bacterium]